MYCPHGPPVEEVRRIKAPVAEAMERDYRKMNLVVMGISENAHEADEEGEKGMKDILN